MKYTGRQRIETALSFKEADRVPVQVRVPDNVRAYPNAKELVHLVDTYCDDFKGIDSIDRGFVGIPSEEIKKDVENSGEYAETVYTYKTAKADFIGVLEQDRKNPRYQHWKKYFIETQEDLMNLAEAEFPDLEIPENYLQELDKVCGDRYVPVIGLYHPFGRLARISPPEQFYVWLYTERELIHRLFEKQYHQLVNAINRLKAPYAYYFVAFEMAIEPYMGREMFDDFIYRYDKKMNECIHKHGGIVTHHSHGPVFKHLEHWAEMGVDYTEPLEMPPNGDTDLREAKKLVGDRMAFGGNIPSQMFIELTNEQIENMVIEAIDSAADGGGFILKCASTACGLNSFRNYEQLDKMISATIHFIESGLKYGLY